MNQRSERLEITSDYVLNTIVDTIERCRQAKPVFDKKGDPVLVFNEQEQAVVPMYAFDPGSVLKGSELLGRHLKLFTEKMEHTGKDGKDLPQSAPILNLTLNK